jgi:hypothetical protein
MLALIILYLFVSEAARLYMYSTNEYFYPVGCAAICNNSLNCFESYQDVMKCPNTSYIVFENDSSGDCKIPELSCDVGYYFSFGLDFNFKMVKGTSLYARGFGTHLTMQNNRMCCLLYDNMGYFVIKSLD